MAQLKDTIVSGNLRVTDTTLTDTLQVTKIKAPTTAGGTTYGPGSNGQVLKSNGTTTYWGDDNNSSTVLQSATTTSNFRPFVFGTKDTTTISSLADTVTGQLYTSTRLFFQPSSGNLYMYSPSGDSPALIFQRGTFIDSSLDWKMYDTGGALRFAQAGRNTSTETWVTVVEHKTATNTASTPAIRSMLGVYGATYGNTAANMLSGTAGLFQYGDGGPQIDFSTSPGGTQSGALIFTDHDTAATGASWHFVSTEADWNVTSKRFHAKTSISIGTNLPNTSYNLYVNGTTNITGATTIGGLLTTQANQYGDNYNSGSIDMQNSNLCGVNAIYTGDTSDNAAEGIHFYRDSTHVDTLWMNGGVLLFVPNRELGSNTSAADSQKVARFTVNPTGGQVVITDQTSGGVKSSGYTIATSVPSGAVFTDTKVTSSANHYTPATASGSDKTASASGATAAWSIDVVKGITINTDGKGHITGLSVTSGKIPANPNTTYTLGTSGNNVTLTPSSGSVQSITVPYATKASLLMYGHTNEINISGGKQATCYFNYRDADTDAQDTGETPISINYKFCNYRNSTADTTITAANFAGNASTATKWKTARTLTIGSTGKSVDGSGNVSWSLAEIGALSSSTTYAGSTTVGGAATNVKITDLNANADAAIYYPTFVSSNGSQALKTNTTNGPRFRHEPGTTSAVGVGRIMLGNATVSGTAGNAKGQIALYSESSGYAMLEYATTAATSTFQLPAKASDTYTLAVTSDIPSTYAGSATAGGIANQAHYLTNERLVSTSMTYGSEKLEWYDLSANNGNDPTKKQNPENDWFHHTTMHHKNNAGYYFDMAYSFNSNAIYYRRVQNGADKGWVRLIDSSNTSFTQTLSSGTKIGSITIAGTSTDIYAPTNTDEKVKVDLFTSTTQTDYMIAGATAAMATTAAHLVIDTADGVASARIRLQKGTTSAVGKSMLMLGNNIASGTAKNMQGSILMYASTANYGTITEAALTDNRTWTMPNKTGTVALTSDIPSFSVTPSGTGPVVTGMSYSSGVLTYTKGRVLSTSGGQWIAGRDNAPVLANSNSSTAGSFYPMGAVKTNTGAWAIGALGNGDSLAFSFSTDTNYSGGSNTTNNYYIGTDGAFTGTAAGLTAKTLTAETLGTTDGSFVFKGTSLFGGTDSYDWVGIQADASNDMFQLVGGGNNGVFFREKDDSSGWSAWYALLTNAMISGSSGITVTPTAFKIGGDDGTTINGAVTISHSNSITASTSTVFKKFSYDACGHITDVAAVAKADIPQLDYIGAKTVGSYWGMTTPANDDSQWIRTSKRGIIPYQLRASDSTATDNTDGSTCYLGTSTWYFAKAFIQEIHGTSFTGTAATADRLKSNSSVGITNGVQYTSGQLTVGTADGNAAEGSNASYKLWSYPAGGTSVSSTSANIQNLRLYWSSTYFRDIFISPNNYDIYHRSVANGTAYAWRKILDSTNYTDYTVTKTGTGATGSWGIDITGSAAGLTAKTLTAETLGTTDGSFVFKGTNLLGATYDWVGFQADADNDKFQIVANNQLMFRQKDSTTWSDWVGCITPNNVSAASGIKVTATTTTIGTGTTAFTYNSGVKIEHDVTTSDDTTDSGSLSHGGTFTAITSVTRDSYGHVTTLNTKTYILPASGNTDTKVNVTLATTTKAYLLGTSTTPTSSAQAVASIADTGVYLDTTAGRLTATTFKGGLYSYNPASDQTLSNAYPTYTVAYFAYSGGYGGTVGRTGNSGTAWWAHYLTFTHSDRNYRYLLRFPYWGPPQYQHTNDGGNKRWCSFITDEHAGNYSKYMGTGTTIDPITGAMNCTHRANKLAFLPAANITVQTSTDSGSTWTNLSVSDDLKRKIFSIPVRNSNINIGPSSGNTTTSMQTRIIIECDGRDAVLDRFMFEIGSGHQNIAIDVYAGTTISGLTKIATSSSSSTWAYEAVVTIDHNPDKYYRFSTSNYKYIAFVFRYTYVDSSYLTERGTINGISGYSGNYWGNNCKSNLAHFDHLYSWDIDQNALFPATVQGEKLAVKSGTYTTTIEKGATSADRTLVLPDASGGIGVANILLNDPTNSTNPVPVYGSLSDYDYFTIVIGMNGSNSEQTSSAIIPAVAGSHFFLFQILESVGSGGSMMFPAGVVITTTSTTISFSLGVNRGINIPSSGTATSIASARTAYIKMIIGHKS